ncbi:HNH endonuclease [Pedobacter nutrimenti]|uniref:5-methylcytosine-specific restriction endonuclease McrA n=1 Tax=Pedobacter nutrimenti TaxID=1241337 RepID=A0A318U618_9SPHI|nr:HNH endonuclease [Pedobacter nutrimenti]PYF68485.1 5-methylcytosine-specific restriction endonuclease McrA [Pedobacter nutrimenti]
MDAKDKIKEELKNDNFSLFGYSSDDCGYDSRLNGKNVSKDDATSILKTIENGISFRLAGYSSDDCNYESRLGQSRKHSKFNRIVGRIKVKRNITAKHRDLIFERDGYKCLMPGCNETSNLTIDHIIPLDLGGRNSIHNYQTLCAFHNQEKGNKIMDFRINKTHIKGKK